MAIEYRNRRGDVYRLLVGKTRSGSPNYYMAKSNKAKGMPVDEIPAGLEIYEDPTSGRVVVRKVREPLTTADELAIVEAGIREQTELTHFLVEQDGDSLVVYISDFEDDRCDDDPLMRLLGRVGREHVMERGTFSKRLRFVLQDEERRLFAAERWCFRGSIDDWWPLPGRNPLPALVEEYVPHLGRESFYELI